MKSKTDTLYQLQKKDIPKAVAVLADAFQDDPVWKIVLEGASKTDKRVCACYETPIRYCLKYGEVYASSENLEGVVAWVPGEFADMSVWRMIRSGAIKPGMRMGLNIARKMKPIFDPMQKDRNENMRGRPYYYIQIIGVASENQGQGYGGSLLRALIKQSEDAATPIYLETETERNVAMYERFGFRLIKQITLPIINLPMWEMVRDNGH